MSVDLKRVVDLEKMPLWLGKLVNYEYWPIGLFYIPVGIYIFCLALKARSFTFFTNVNPSIKDSGILRYSKFSVLKYIPDEFKTKGILIKSNDKLDFVEEMFTFPIITKPDMGERGKGVTLISDMSALKKHAENIDQDFIIQEFCDFPEEAAIFYVRKPTEAKGRITSFTTKEFLTVTGDGRSTIRQLMTQSFRARLQIYRQTTAYLNIVPQARESVTIEAIGNHNRGTRFINYNHLISEALTDVFDQISISIPGFYYGRYDLKFKDLKDLEMGKNFKIVELNGINSEPVHIYDQTTGLWNAYQDFFKHIRYMYQISQENYKLGFKRSNTWKFWSGVFCT
jgi:hypothetical protein